MNIVANCLCPKLDVTLAPEVSWVQTLQCLFLNYPQLDNATVPTRGENGKSSPKAKSSRPLPSLVFGLHLLSRLDDNEIPNLLHAFKNQELLVTLQHIAQAFIPHQDLGPKLGSKCTSHPSDTTTKGFSASALRTTLVDIVTAHTTSEGSLISGLPISEAHRCLILRLREELLDLSDITVDRCVGIA